MVDRREGIQSRERVLPVRDDRIYPETRALAALIVPFLVLAFAILYFFPGDTQRLWAWTVRPTMMPMVMGAGYIGGGYFFVRAIVAARWHEITVGFLPVTTFASSMLLATLLHLDRFNQTSPAFWVWLIIYLTTPFLVFATWLRNRRTDSGALGPGDVPIPSTVRAILGTAGGLVLGTGVVLFLLPTVMIGLWPWTLTPLTAQVMGGWFALPGVFGLTMARDGRWSAARIALQSQAFSIVLLLIAVARAWPEFDPAKVTTYLFVGGMAVLLVGIIALYAALDRRSGIQVARSAK